MQYITDDYSQEMNQQWRGHTSVHITIGIINNDAQTSAKITSSFSGNETNLYDGSARGEVTSTEADGSITFTFVDQNEIDLAGLTIIFGSAPSSVAVTNGTKTVTDEVISSSYTLDSRFENCHYITITPNSGKLKIKSIRFGVGVEL